MFEGVEGPVGVAGEDVVVPPPQATSIKDKRFAVMVKNSLRPFLRGIDEERYRTDGIKKSSSANGSCGKRHDQKSE